MVIDYGELEPIAYPLSPSRTLDLPKDADWYNVSVSPNDEVYGVYHREKEGSVVLDLDQGGVALQWPKREIPLFNSVQRFVDGRWLVLYSRARGLSENAFVFDSDGSFSHAFHAGDAIETVLIDRSGRIWIGYFDEADGSLGGQGLVCLDETGELLFGFQGGGGRFFIDIYAMTLDDWDQLWLCPFSDFFVARVAKNLTASIELERCPVSYSYAMCVGQKHYLFFGGPKHPSRVTLVDRSTQWLRSVELTDQEGKPLLLGSLSTRGGTLIGIGPGDGLFRLDLELLLRSLGRWTEHNASTVQSALDALES